MSIDPKHKKFADRYLVCGKISEAARHAGYSPQSAHVSGNRLLKRPDVQHYLAQQAAKVTKSEEDLQSRVLSELETMAFANISKFIRVEDGVPQVDFSSATEEELKAIASVATKRKVTTGKDGSVTVETDNRFSMSDKYRGLELLGKHLGMFKEAEQRIVVDVADRLLAARRRLSQLSDREDGIIEVTGGGGTGV